MKVMQSKQPRHTAPGLITLAILMLAGVTAARVEAQTVQFNAAQVRVTVPINSTNTTVVTNLVTIDSAVLPVVFTVTGLPPGASATLTDTNGNPLLAATSTTNLVMTVNTTNIAGGVYTFSLNASGGAVNNMFFVLQAAHVWNGSPGVSNNWANASSWLGGGVPGSANDVVFGDLGAQTNLTFVNVGIDADTEVGSMRFSQTALTNAVVPDEDMRASFHNLRIAPNTTLSVTGTNGFSLLRDYVDNFYITANVDDHEMGVTVAGGAGSRLVVSNASANFALLVANQSFGNHSFLNLSNLNNFVAHVNRMGLAEFQLYPNYRNYNDANNFSDNPSQFLIDLWFARTNVITATYQDPDNYNNEFTRSYAFSLGNNEVDGNGSSINSFIQLGQSNAFFLDSFCIGRANYAIGNGGAFRFNPIFPNSTALFRNVGGGRMSVFAIADSGGTNRATDTTRMNNVDFASGNGLADILADRFYMSRDRKLIASNNNPVVESVLTFGRGVIDVNTAILGFQEHDGKDDWPTISGGAAEAYRNYCRADLIVTNGGTFRVNGNLTLGYTADSNPAASAQQFNTRGTITIYGNSTVMASNIIADGGLNFYDANGRVNSITMIGGTLIVTNSLGGAPGLPLDSLSMNNATLVLQNVDPARTNAHVRTLLTPGSTPSTIKIVSVTGVSAYPVQIPVISYETAAPFLVADVSPVGGGLSAYILDNVANKTVDVYITTNPPNALVWSGSVSGNWDTTTKNWRTVVGGIQTNFTLGDTVTFDDSSTVNNITIVGSVVPGQVGTGVTVSNSTRNYTFSGGTIAGTGNLLKQGPGSLTVAVTKQGPVTISAGTVNVSGALGLTTLAAGATLNSSGFVNGGLTSTGTVSLAVGSSVNGGVAIRGGTFVNAGTVSTAPGALAITGNSLVTNTVDGVINVAGGNWAVTVGSILANFGSINNLNGRLNIEGVVFGTGNVTDPNSTLANPDGRIAIRPGALLSPGNTPANSIGTFHANGRLDHDAQNGVHGRLLIEVDFNHAQTNDVVAADQWNNLNGLIQMVNINPAAGSFANGQSFQVFANNNGLGVPNQTDAGAAAQMPIIEPIIPGPGLHWNVADLRTNGFVGVTNGLVWRGNVNGDWDLSTANWLGGATYADEQGVLFDDSATGPTTVNLTAIVAPASTNRLPTIAPGIIVNNTLKDYTFTGSGSITGATGIYKAGSGTLTILTATNSYTGRTILSGGRLVVTTLANVNQPSSIGTPGAAGTPGGNAIGAERLVIDGATLSYAGGNASANRPATFGPGGATLQVISNSTALTLSGTLLGEGGLTKTGPGLLLLSGANTYAGITTISDGTLALSASGRASTNGITLAGGNLQFAGPAAGFTLNNGIHVPVIGSTIINTNNNVSDGVWTGGGTVTFDNTDQLSLNDSIAGFSGTISLGSSSGVLRFNSSTNGNDCTGSAAATFNLGTGTATLNNHNGGGLTYDLGALLGGPNTTLSGRSSNATTWAATTTYRIGANGSNTVFAGTIANGQDTVSITKVGSGTLLLNGNNTYTGTTTVSAGTLGGTGAISGPVSVELGGTLAPGASIGTLTINSNLTLAGTTAVEISKTGSTLTSDRIIGLTSVSFGGDLVVNHLGPDALAAGDSFQLFNAGGAGDFARIIATPLPPGLGFAFNPATGVLSVVSAGSQPQLNFGRVGNNLVFTWTGAFKLQAQTNSVAVGISNNWADYPGGGSSGVSVPIDPNSGTVFFRLVSTP